MKTAAARPLTIGLVARDAGIGVETVRFYERQGLIERIVFNFAVALSITPPLRYNHAIMLSTPKTLISRGSLVSAGGIGEPYFCKFLCPAGTLEAGLTLGLLRPELRSLLGFLFLWKAVLLALFLVAMVFIYRPFCRVACPLGAFYGLFNCFSLWRLEVAAGCDHCGRCRHSCPLGIQVDVAPNSAECIRCLACRDACPRGLLSFGIKASRGSDHTVQDGCEGGGVYHA